MPKIILSLTALLIMADAATANQTRPCEQQGQPQQTAEPPLAVGVAAPIVVNPANGFVPYHLIPRPRFPIAEAVVERCRCVIQQRPRLWRR